MGVEELCNFSEVVANLICHVEKEDARHPSEDPVKVRMDDDDDDDEEEEEEDDEEFDEDDKADDADCEIGEHERMEWSSESEVSEDVCDFSARK